MDWVVAQDSVGKCASICACAGDLRLVVLVGGSNGCSPLLVDFSFFT